jgi:transketolase
MIKTTSENTSVLDLQKELRLKTLDLYYKVKAGHIGCSLSCIDLLIGLFLFVKDKEDMFVLSKGHAAAALYAILHQTGEISTQTLATFYTNGTLLPAHPAANKYPSIPFATGSLGHGLPLAVGVAKARKLKKDNSLVFVLLSDGETNEGTTWEASLFAVQHQLSNLIVVIDKNGIQGFDTLENVIGDSASSDKFRALGYEVYECDGHNIESFISVLNACKKSEVAVPKIVIANTIKGKGVDYMENTVDWHYWPMSEELYKEAVNQIKRKYSA